MTVESGRAGIVRSRGQVTRFVRMGGWGRICVERSASVARVYRKYFPLILGLWVLFVLYPNPLNLVVSIQRIYSPDIDANAVEFVLEEFPSSPQAVEEMVLGRIPYSYDWEVHGMPWYFPTTERVLEKGRGDCKARAIVLASILEAKHIPYRFNSSPVHVWVDYEGKGETALENPEVRFYQQDPETGERFFQLPDIRLGEVMDSMWRGFWPPMPDARKALLLSGIFILVFCRAILFKNRPQGIDKREVFQ
ncbi:MAG: transglutaminase domain-containing protein [Dehalococcoidia bacterium]|nr:transglutaminase domain-containing protein [Dehalococcoidia bacterium]